MLLIVAICVMFFDALIPISERNIKPSDFVILVGAATKILTDTKKWVHHCLNIKSVSVIFVALSAIALVSGLNANSDKMFNVYTTAAQFLFIAFVFTPLVLIEVESAKKKSQIFFTIQILIGISGLLSIFEKLGITNIGQNHYSRIVNPMVGTNGFYIAGLINLFGVDLLINGSRDVKLNKKILVFIAVVASSLGIVLSQSRASVVLAVLMVIVFLLLNQVASKPGVYMIKPAFNPKRFIFLLPTAIFFVIGWLAFQYLDIDISRFGGESDGNRLLKDEDRSGLMGSAISAILKFDNLTGVGFGAGLITTDNMAAQNVHNVYVQLVYENGILGLVAVAFLLGFAARNIWVTIRAIRIGCSPMENCGEETIKNRRINITSLWIVLGTILVVFNVYPIGYNRMDWLLFIVALAPLSKQYSRIHGKLRV
jgi:O-antigen ligase